MINKTIGHIILEGGTTEKLRKEFPDFSPTKEYLCSLGYKEATAKRYITRLRKNEKNSSTSLTNKSSEIIETSEPEIRFVESENVDYTNLLVDTCALGSAETMQLIEQADRITFIKSIIEEMDKKKNSKKKFASKIRLYMEKILFDPKKYMLSSFPGLDDETYTDNILLQYLLILPKQIRPTLLTVDKNLAIKARMWDLPYILYLMPKEKKSSNSESKKKLLGYGICKVTEENAIYIKYNGTYRVTIIRSDESEIVYNGDKVKVEIGDKVRIDIKAHQKITPHYLEIK